MDVFGDIKSEISELSKDELLVQYECLKKSLNLKDNELERKEQALYSTARKLQLQEAIVDELKQENDILKCMSSTGSDEIRKKYEEKIVSLTNEHAKKIENYELVAVQKDKNIEDLNKTLAKLSSKVAEQTLDDRTHQENVQLAIENGDLKEEISVLNDKYILLFNKHEKIQQEYQDTLVQFNIMKEELSFKKEQLMTTNLQVSDLQEQVIVLRTQLIPTDKPHDVNIRGNSVFAEVNDKSEELRKKIKHLYSQYQELQSCNEKLVEKEAKTSNAIEDICKQWKKDLESKNYDQVEMEDRFQKCLEKAEKLQMNKIQNDCEIPNTQYVNAIDELNKTIRDLYFQILQLKSFLNEARDEVRCWRQKTMALENSICNCALKTC